MADNVPITAGSGTTIATDDIAGVHYQRVKLVNGTLDDATAIPGSGTGLYVDPHGTQTRILVTPTISSSPAYTSGDALGGSMTFSNAARISGGSGIIQSAMIVDLAKQDSVIELYLFNQAFTAGTDNAAWVVTESDLSNLVCILKFDPAAGEYIDVNTAANGSSVAQKLGIGVPFICSGTANLFGGMIIRTASTYVASTDIKVILTILQD